MDDGVDVDVDVARQTGRIVDHCWRQKLGLFGAISGATIASEVVVLATLTVGFSD